MLNTETNKLLRTIDARRKIGKSGLPKYLLRDEQVKVRFTESDRVAFSEVSANAGAPSEAQFLYVLAVAGIREMLKTDPALAAKIRATLTDKHMPLPEWFE